MTAETAVALPVMLVLLWGCMSVVAGVHRQTLCQDAASAAVRLAARGQQDSDVSAVVHRIAGPAQVSIEREGGTVLARVTTSLRLPLGPSITIEAQALAVDEGGTVP